MRRFPHLEEGWIVPRIIYATANIVAALVALYVPSPTIAQDTFQAEAGLSYSRYKDDTVRQSSLSAEATYFFDKLPSRPRDYPIEQAQFVERIGSFSANYGRTSLEIDNTQSLSNGSMYGASVDFRQPNMPFILSAGYESFYSGKSGSLSGILESEGNTKAYQLSIGAYVDKTTALSLDWSRSKTRTKFTSGGAFLSDFDDTFTSVGVSGKHLVQLSGGDHLAFDASVSRTTHEPGGEKNRDFFIQTTYYPIKTLGLNLGVVFDRGDNLFTEGETYLAGARMFVTPTFSLSLDFLHNHGKTSGNDYDVVTLKALARF